MGKLKTAATATVLAATGLLATACGHSHTVYVPSTTHHVVVHHTVVHHVVVHHVIHHTVSLRKR